MIRYLKLFDFSGSRCYSIYTYQQSDWESKNRNYFWPKKISNKYIEHGNKYEKHALEKYKQANKYDVCEMGLIICKNYPWLAYSPDGIVMSNGMPCRLVEIKCPYDGIIKVLVFMQTFFLKIFYF